MREEVIVNNLNKTVKDWLRQPADELCYYHVQGDRLVSADSGTTGAVRYVPVDSKRPVVIARDNFPHSVFLGHDVQLFVVSSANAARIFKFFDMEYAALRGRVPLSDNSSIRQAITGLAGIGAPLPTRLARATRCPENVQDVFMTLLAFCDIRVPRAFRYAAYRKSDITMPPRALGSSLEIDQFIVFSHEEDAVQTKLASSSSITIVDLWGDEVEASRS